MNNKGFVRLGVLFGLIAVVLFGTVLFLNKPAVQPVEATVVAPQYPDPKAPECVDGQVDIKDNQGFSIGVLDYRWHITSQTSTTVTYQLQLDINPGSGRTWVDKVLGKKLPTKTVDIPDCEPVDPCDPPVYTRLSNEIDNIDYPVDPCVTPSPEPTPTEEPGQPGNPPTFAGSSTDAPGVCTDASIGTVGGIYVDRGVANDGKLEVRWWPAANADRAHIKYTDGEVGDWRYALLNTENDGVQEIGGLQNGKHYWFIVAGVSGCAVGPWSSAFDPLP